MRITERAMYFLGVCLATLYYIENIEQLGGSKKKQAMYNYLLILLIVAVTIWGAIYEGIRVQQYLFLMSFATIAVFVMLDIYSVVALTIFVIVMVLLIVSNAIYGDANFSELKMVGPYQVGHKDIYTSK